MMTPHSTSGAVRPSYAVHRPAQVCSAPTTSHCCCCWHTPVVCYRLHHTLSLQTLPPMGQQHHLHFYRRWLVRVNHARLLWAVLLCRQPAPTTHTDAALHSYKPHQCLTLGVGQVQGTSCQGTSCRHHHEPAWPIMPHTTTQQNRRWGWRQGKHMTHPTRQRWAPLLHTTGVHVRWRASECNSACAWLPTNQKPGSSSSSGGGTGSNARHSPHDHTAWSHS